MEDGTKRTVGLESQTGVLGNADQQRQQQPHDEDRADTWDQSRDGSCGTGGELGHAKPTMPKRGNVAHRPHMPELVGQAQAWADTDCERHGRHQGGRTRPGSKAT